MKRFNITGLCCPEEHYMVDITDRIAIIRGMIAQGDYFCINRGRQYGKTTTLEAIASQLNKEYLIFDISFEGLDDDTFASVASTCAAFLKLLKQEARTNGAPEQVMTLLKKVAPMGQNEVNPIDFKDIVEELCLASELPIVILIDEVDQASGNDGFIKFLGLLRNMFLSRKKFRTFQSVILASVHDIKNLKLKIRTEGDTTPNSPWNISTPFELDMSLQEEGIRQMLEEYETDHHTGMNTVYIARQLRSYTHGYPFLVSRLCMLMDQQSDWTRNGFFRAVKVLLAEKNTFYDNINKKISQYPELGLLMRSILFNGEEIPYNSNVEWQEICLMYGYIRVVEETGKLAIDNRILETMLYNKFIDEDKVKYLLYNEGASTKMNYTQEGHLDMRHVLHHFCTAFEQIYGKQPDVFIEKEGRRLFMMFLRPIINGVGHYYVEAETRDYTKTDLIIDYLGEQFIIEMKIWRGESYNKRGEKQLLAYMDYFQTKTAYMLSFCFNKNKQPGIHEVKIGDYTLVEAVV